MKTIITLVVLELCPNKMSKECDVKALSAEELREREFYWAKEYGTRNFGIGVQCDKCRKFRMAFEWAEEKDVPEYVECSMIRIDGQMGNCSIPSHLTDDSDEFSEGEFVPGDVVLAKLSSYPWWPAIITDDVTQPENHFIYERNGKKFYHLEFFDTKRSSRALVSEKCIKPYDGKNYSMKNVKGKCKENLEKSLELARKSLQVPLRVRVYWMLKYIKYRKQKYPINVDDIPLSVQLDEDLGNEVDSSAQTHNGNGKLEASGQMAEYDTFDEDSNFSHNSSDNPLQMTENMNSEEAEEDFFTQNHNGDEDEDMDEDILPQDTYLDGSAVGKSNPLSMPENMHSEEDFSTQNHNGGNMDEDILQQDTYLDGSAVEKSNPLYMPENMHSEEDFSIQTHNGSNMHEDILQHATCHDGSPVEIDDLHPCIVSQFENTDTEDLLTQIRNSLEDAIGSLTNPGVVKNDDRSSKDSSEITEDEALNSENELVPEEHNRTNIELIFLNCTKRKEPDDEKYILQSELYENDYENNPRFRMYKYCRMSL